MKKIVASLILISSLLQIGCGSKTATTEETVATPKVPVEVTTISNGSVSNNIELLAKASYLKNSLVTAPIPAFITAVHVKIGDRVQQGQLLYELESKERRALGNMPIRYDSSLAGYGKVKVKASASGIIKTLDQQAGSYILEGTTLCTIAQTSGMAFLVNVPFEFIGYVRSGSSCTIVLPDNTKHQAVFTTPLVGMNVNAQTQTMLAQTRENLILPEGLVAKVVVNKTVTNDRQVLPQACVLTDEMMQNFWIMKLINDSTAVKISVIVGNRNRDEMEIVSPRFTGNDRILSNGNYGLPDTALVTVVTKK